MSIGISEYTFPSSVNSPDSEDFVPRVNAPKFCKLLMAVSMWRILGGSMALLKILSGSPQFQTLIFNIIFSKGTLRISGDEKSCKNISKNFCGTNLNTYPSATLPALPAL